MLSDSYGIQLKIDAVGFLISETITMKKLGVKSWLVINFCQTEWESVQEIYGIRRRLSFRLRFGKLRRDYLARQSVHGE